MIKSFVRGGFVGLLVFIGFPGLITLVIAAAYFFHLSSGLAVILGTAALIAFLLGGAIFAIKGEKEEEEENP